jgi:hypothetical protein
MAGFRGNHVSLSARSSCSRPVVDALLAGRLERPEVIYLEDRAGIEFDPDLVAAFVRLVRQSDVELRVLTDDVAAPEPRAVAVPSRDR